MEGRAPLCPIQTSLAVQAGALLGPRDWGFLARKALNATIGAFAGLKSARFSSHARCGHRAKIHNAASAAVG